VAALAAPLRAQSPGERQGTWTNGSLTPFERPAAPADKPFYTKEEAAAYGRQARARPAIHGPRRAGDVDGDDGAFVDRATRLLST